MGVLLRCEVPWCVGSCMTRHGTRAGKPQSRLRTAPSQQSNLRTWALRMPCLLSGSCSTCGCSAPGRNADMVMPIIVDPGMVLPLSMVLPFAAMVTPAIVEPLGAWLLAAASFLAALAVISGASGPTGSCMHASTICCRHSTWARPGYDTLHSTARCAHVRSEPSTCVRSAPLTSRILTTPA